MDTLLYRHLIGESTEPEEEQMFAWLEESEENRNYFFDIAAIWSAHATLSSLSLKDRCDAMLHRLNARIDADEAMRRTVVRTRPVWRRWMSAAAAGAVIVIAVMTAWFAGWHTPGGPVFKTYVNQSGEIVSLWLEDGTQVWLQDAAELRYAVGGNVQTRTARLKGEAYFDVAHDASHPFVVETRDLAVQVLGTAFNVRAMAGDPLTEVVLERGSVRLLSPEGNNMVRLHPDQRAVYNAESDDIEVEQIHATHLVTERYNLVSMKNATVGEIIATVEKSYGVLIRIDSPGDQKRYDINYLRSNSLEEVIDIVEFMTGQHCEVIRNQ